MHLLELMAQVPYDRDDDNPPFDGITQFRVNGFVRAERRNWCLLRWLCAGCSAFVRARWHRGAFFGWCVYVCVCVLGGIGGAIDTPHCALIFERVRPEKVFLYINDLLCDCEPRKALCISHPFDHLYAQPQVCLRYFSLGCVCVCVWLNDEPHRSHDIRIELRPIAELLRCTLTDTDIFANYPRAPAWSCASGLMHFLHKCI